MRFLELHEVLRIHRDQITHYDRTLGAGIWAYSPR